METDLQTNLAFYLTGKRLDAHLDAVDELKLRPALFNGYRDLTDQPTDPSPGDARSDGRP